MEADIKVIDHNFSCGVYGRYKFRTYEWIGPKNGRARINKHLFNEHMNELPWKLRIIDNDVWMNSYIVVRTDKLLYLNSIIQFIKALIKRNKTIIKSRIILTAMVWNLASVPECELPQWKHFNVFKHIKKHMKR